MMFGLLVEKRIDFFVVGEQAVEFVEAVQAGWLRFNGFDQLLGTSGVIHGFVLDDAKAIVENLVHDVKTFFLETDFLHVVVHGNKR